MAKASAAAPSSSLIERAQRAIRRVLERQQPKAEAAPRFPATPFGEWNYDEAIAAIRDANNASKPSEQSGGGSLKAAGAVPGGITYPDPRLKLDQYAINLAFFNGDHWQDGSGWIGPHPQIEDKDYRTAMNELVAAFTSKNVVKEVTARHASGVIGREPQWSFVPRRSLKEGEKPNEKEQTAIAIANALVKEWWDKRKVRSLLHDAVCTLLLGSRAPLRLYIPAGLLDESESGEGVIRAESIEQALGMIWPDHPAPNCAAVVVDADTKMEAGAREYAQPKEDAIDQSKSDEDEDLIELVFLDRSGKTIVRVMREGDDPTDAKAPAPDDFEFDFGARLTMMEMHRDTLISPQVAQQQRALNLALSMLPRNVISGGFLERVLLNAQMPGRYVADAEGQPKKFIPDGLQFGAGVTNFIVGVEQRDAQGNKTNATPSMLYREPIPVDSSIEASDKHYLDILDEVSQLHVVLSGDGTISGKSREQARAEYLQSLNDTVGEVESALRFLLETPLAMAEALSGKIGELTSLIRAEAQCRVDTGPLDATERKANEDSIGKTISRETAMARNNVSDTDAELARMADDPLSRAALVKAQGDALKSVTDAGVSIETAAEMLQIDPAIARKIAKDRESAGFSEPAAGGDQTSVSSKQNAEGEQPKKDEKGMQQQGSGGSQAGGDA